MKAKNNLSSDCSHLNFSILLINGAELNPGLLNSLSSYLNIKLSTVNEFEYEFVPRNLVKQVHAFVDGFNKEMKKGNINKFIQLNF